MQRLSEFLARLAAAERREYAAHPRRYPRRRHLHDRVRPRFPSLYIRDVANELAAKGNDNAAIFLDETDGWTQPYFKPDSIKANRRLMFFRPATTTWFDNATRGGH